jgi:hypothetical protein
MAKVGDKVEQFVNDFVYEYLSRDVEFSDVYEDEEAEDFTEEEQRKAHQDIHILLRRIRKTIYGE